MAKIIVLKFLMDSKKSCEKSIDNFFSTTWFSYETQVFKGTT
jgi:hypothetical protein